METQTIKRVSRDGAIEQFNGREGETATFLSCNLLNSKLCVAVSPHVISAVGHLRVNYMKCEFKQIFIAFLAIIASCLTLVAQIQKTKDEVPTVSFCELVDKPTLYDEKHVRVEAFYTSDFEAAFMYDETCGEPIKRAWVSFDSDIEKLTEREIWKDYEKYVSDNQAVQPQTKADCKLHRYKFTWTGLFKGVKPTFKVGNRIVSQGFGHMNSYAYKFTAQKIEKVIEVVESVPCN